MKDTILAVKGLSKCFTGVKALEMTVPISYKVGN